MGGAPRQGWTILVARLADEDAAQAAVTSLGDGFLSRAAKARGGISRRPREDAIVLIAEADGQLGIRDAHRLRAGMIRRILRGVLVRLTLGFVLTGTIQATLGMRGYLRSRHRHRTADAQGPLAGVLDALAPGQAALVARVADTDLQEALDGLDGSDALGVAHAPEPDVRAALGREAETEG